VTMVKIDKERAEPVFQEMRAEHLEKYPNLSGHARLIFEMKLREAVREGAEAFERKRIQQGKWKKMDILLNFFLVAVTILSRSQTDCSKTNLKPPL
jgi:hypothetical protein